MDKKYKDWINKKLELSNGLGKCYEWTWDMVKDFPELKRVRGHYFDFSWGERGHWWCIDKEGKVIDPTAEQFPSKGKGVYVEWTEGEEEPTGKCMNCGEYCYNNNQFCCTICENEVMAEYAGLL